MPDSFPHEKIVGAMFLISFVGGSELKEAALSEMEKHGGCDRSCIQIH